MSFVETRDDNLCSTTGAVLRAAVAVENAPYALMGSGEGAVAEVASCAPGNGRKDPVSAVASCGQKIHRDPAPVAAFASCDVITPVEAFASCSVKIGQDTPSVEAFASCGDF